MKRLLELKTLITLLLVVAMSSVFVACGDDDTPTTPTTIDKELLIGKKWEPIKLVIDDKEIAPNFNCAEKHGYTLYKADGKSVDISYNSNCKENINKDDKWELSGNTLIMIFEENISEEYSNGELTSKETTIGKLYFTIKTLTNSKLVLELSKKTEDGKEVLIDKNEDGKQDKTIAYYKSVE